ncbi:MAG TPA: alkaline phosphatase family protein [Candidatus Limisoma gallistercoris]|nr:alkaline phosphatase family protein [Candidatus Limisoma gallistercoris]
MHKYLFSFLLAAILAMPAMAQNPFRRPKLVVGVVVDQMRWDYLYRYQERFGDNGFKRLMREGFNCENTMLNYIPAVTAIGHTSIYTGSVPAIHGIAGNDFHIDGKQTYCTDDAAVATVGSNSDAGKMSPHNLKVTTIGDELHLATNYRSKVISVSLKDRASILPGGHTADGAYWFDAETGNFITSTYYRKDLPGWLKKFNDRQLAKHYLSQDWETLYPTERYKNSTADNNSYENPFPGADTPTMPVTTSKLMDSEGLGLIRNTPYGNTLTIDLALAAIDGERLGNRGETDMLAVSLSSTDYIGHQFGTYAIETEDTYLRLDCDIARLLAALDQEIGKGEYLLFLTADHAAAHNFKFLTDKGIPAGGWDIGKTKAALNSHLKAEFKTDCNLVSGLLNYQIFLDNEKIDSLGISKKNVVAAAIDYIKRGEGVYCAVEQENAGTATLPSPIKDRIVNGYYPGRSGEIQIIMQPGWYGLESEATGGTDHGVWHPYDTHVPLIFFGSGINPGATFTPVEITDIAATVCALLHIQMPDGCIGKPVTELTK